MSEEKNSSGKHMTTDEWDALQKSKDGKSTFTLSVERVPMSLEIDYNAEESRISFSLKDSDSKNIPFSIEDHTNVMSISLTKSVKMAFKFEI